MFIFTHVPCFICLFTALACTLLLLCIIVIIMKSSVVDTFYKKPASQLRYIIIRQSNWVFIIMETYIKCQMYALIRKYIIDSSD
jgi:hypothetical protein